MNNKSYTRESIFNHEIAHALTAMAKNKFYFDSEVFTEMHSIFMTLYTNNYLYSNTKKEIYINGNINYLNYLNLTINRINYIDIISRLKIINKNTIEKAILKETSMNLIDMDKWIEILSQVDIQESFKYFISGILAMHLLSFDDEKRNFLFKKTMLKNYKDENTLLKDIELNHKDNFFIAELFQNNIGYYNYIRKRN